MISKEEVQHIAKLARLELTEKEVVKMQKDLSLILSYFNVLKKAPKVAKITKAVKIVKNALRKDEVIQKPAGLASNLVAQVPDKKDNYIKVKSILQ